MTHNESDWRCSRDGAFHTLDMSASKQVAGRDHRLCTKCRTWADASLIETGMATCVNIPAPPPPKLTVIADVDAFNAALKDWLSDTYVNHIGDTRHSFAHVLRCLPLNLVRYVTHKNASGLVPRLPDGMTEAQAVEWCQNMITTRMSDPDVTYLVRMYPTVQHCVSDLGTKAAEYYDFRFRIYTVTTP